MREEEEVGKSRKESDSPVIKKLFSIKNQLANTIGTANELKNSFGRIDSSLQPDPVDKEDKKEQDFGSLTLSEKLSYIDGRSSEIEKLIIELLEKFRQWL